ncbi:hypothetical protein D5F01_LYC02486 [Larimichthys crocea]|uniref:Uncharacterized protein n=1 Tax=Larimichthys crocea TaxID=215358 RepID=A0A6G0J2R6_LARCR|nr:hypothetical protein D5F01_LYC02486 [Larimichthys crocea]
MYDRANQHPYRYQEFPQQLPIIDQSVQEFLCGLVSLGRLEEALLKRQVAQLEHFAAKLGQWTSSPLEAWPTPALPSVAWPTPVPVSPLVAWPTPVLLSLTPAPVPKPAMPPVPKHPWLMQVYAQDVLQSLDEIKPTITSQYRRILKMDSTKKVVPKLAGHSYGTGTWAGMFAMIAHNQRKLWSLADGRSH